MAANSYVCLYLSYLEALEPFSDAERGRLMTGMLSYAATGTVPSFAGNERFIWPTIQAQIDRDQKAYADRCEQNRRNGTRGGRPRKQTVSSESEGFSGEPKKTKEREKENENEKEREKAYTGFTPPTVSQVRNYCQEMGYELHAQKFVDYYTANGWQMGNTPMQDWQAAVRIWKARDEQHGTSEVSGYGAIGREL